MKKDVLDLSFSKVPMLKPLVALILGIILGSNIDVAHVYLFPYIIIALFIALILLFYYQSFPFRKTSFAINFYLLMLLLGVWGISVNRPKHNNQHFSHHEGIQVVGIIADEPVVKDKTIRFPLEVIAKLDSQANHLVDGKIMVTILRDSVVDVDFSYGDKLIFNNVIAETTAPYNPKEFNYKAYLANKGIWHQVFLRSGEFKIIARDNGNYILKQSLILRQQLIDKFAKYIHDPEAFQIAIALIFGYRSQVEVSTLDAFTNTGTIHVLSVSGMHVSLVFGFLTLLLFWLDRFKYGKWIRCVFIFVTVWFYVILTGMSPPILRAGIMISFFIASTVFGRRQVGLNTLLASAFFILIFAPQYLFDVGFQLSYAAILGILILYPICRELCLPHNRWLGYIVEYCYVSIAAQLFTLPLALYYFGQFPFYFLVANLFIALPSTAIMYLGVLLVISPLDFINHFIGKLLDWILVFSVDGLQYISHLPMAVSKGIVWDYWQVVLLSIVLIFCVLSLNYANKKAVFRKVIVLFLLQIYSSFQQMKYNAYVGLRIYNVRSELAIAHINKGKVVLCTTMDSLTHATLRFSVLPDLLRYAKEEDIVFRNIRNDQRLNYQLQLGGKKYLILEKEWIPQDTTTYDYIIWRKNTRSNVESLLKGNRDALIIIDGSNSAKSIDKLYSIILNSNAIYRLKNNFAYVWDED